MIGVTLWGQTYTDYDEASRATGLHPTTLSRLVKRQSAPRPCTKIVLVQGAAGYSSATSRQAVTLPAAPWELGA